MAEHRNRLRRHRHLGLVQDRGGRRLGLRRRDLARTGLVRLEGPESRARSRPLLARGEIALRDEGGFRQPFPPSSDRRDPDPDPRIRRSGRQQERRREEPPGRRSRRLRRSPAQPRAGHRRRRPDRGPASAGRDLLRTHPHPGKLHAGKRALARRKHRRGRLGDVAPRRNRGLRDRRLEDRELGGGLAVVVHGPLPRQRRGLRGDRRPERGPRDRQDRRRSDAGGGRDRHVLRRREQSGTEPGGLGDRRRSTSARPDVRWRRHDPGVLRRRLRSVVRRLARGG